MNREIKFKFWDGYEIINEGNGIYVEEGKACSHWNEELEVSMSIMQYTGLKDSNGKVYIYEGDIINIHGDVIGNKYENKELLKDKTNFLIEGLCTSKWCNSYKEAMERGCQNAE